MRPLASLVIAIALSSCHGSEEVRPTMNVSIGQQLIDLKKARDSGALTEQQYQSEKAQLIKSVH
jgi:hypothetical protein